MTRFLLLSALAAGALSLTAQVRQTIDVTLIEVPVVVSSANGDPVRGLTKDNFTILDEGKQRQIATFEVVDFGSPQQKSAITPVNPMARRSFLLLFDLSNATPNALKRSQTAARKFVEASLEPLDLVSVATLDAERGYRSLTAFTTDRQLISSAIDAPASFRSRDPFGLANSTLAFIPGLEAPGAGSTDGGSGRYAAEAESYELAMAHNMAHMNEGLVRQRVDRQLAWFSQIADSLAAAPGRKQIVLLSEGVPAKILTGRDARDGKAAAEQAERIIRGTWASKDAELADGDQDQRFGSTRTLSLLQAMAEFFKKSDVVMHALDVQGIRVQGTTYGGATINSNSGLAVIARATGGQIFDNVNDVGENFQRLLHRQEVVYVLGFYAPSEKRGAFHDLKVKVTGTARRAQVEARRGYYEGGRAPNQRAASDAEVIVHDRAESSIHIASFAGAFPSSGGNAQVPVVIEIDGRDLTDATMLSPEATLAVFAFDEQGTVRDRILDSLRLNTANTERVRERGLKYYATLRLPPGNYAIKTLLRVASGGRRGYARSNIRVPAAGEFGVVPFLIEEDPAKWVLVRGTSHDAEGDVFPFQINGEPMMPSVLPRLSASDTRRIALFIRNADGSELSVDATPRANIVQSIKSSDMMKLILETAPIGDESAFNVVVTKGESEALRARLPVVIQ